MARHSKTVTFYKPYVDFQPDGLLKDRTFCGLSSDLDLKILLLLRMSREIMVRLAVFTIPGVLERKTCRKIPQH